MCENLWLQGHRDRPDVSLRVSQELGALFLQAISHAFQAQDFLLRRTVQE